MSAQIMFGMPVRVRNRVGVRVGISDEVRDRVEVMVRVIFDSIGFRQKFVRQHNPNGGFIPQNSFHAYYG